MSDTRLCRTCGGYGETIEPTSDGEYKLSVCRHCLGLCFEDIPDPDLVKHLEQSLFPPDESHKKALKQAVEALNRCLKGSEVYRDK